MSSLSGHEIPPNPPDPVGLAETGGVNAESSVNGATNQLTSEAGSALGGMGERGEVSCLVG